MVYFSRNRMNMALRCLTGTNRFYRQIAYIFVSIWLEFIIRDEASDGSFGFPYMDVFEFREITKLRWRYKMKLRLNLPTMDQSKTMGIQDADRIMFSLHQWPLKLPDGKVAYSKTATLCSMAHRLNDLSMQLAPPKTTLCTDSPRSISGPYPRLVATPTWTNELFYAVSVIKWGMKEPFNKDVSTTSIASKGLRIILNKFNT